MEVVRWDEDCWNGLGPRLGVHDSKMFEIFSEQHRMQALADHYINHYPIPSWNKVAEALHGEKLHKEADEVTTEYVKGMDVNHVMCLILIQAVDGQRWYSIFIIKLISVI